MRGETTRWSSHGAESAKRPEGPLSAMVLPSMDRPAQTQWIPPGVGHEYGLQKAVVFRPWKQ